MRKAQIFVNGMPAGILEEMESGRKYSFKYHKDYQGAPVSLTMPLSQNEFLFDRFPPFFEGLLPEGDMLDGLIRGKKIDPRDYFSQLIAVGGELVGNVTVTKGKS
jgi:serine/threonine-protein kinase HipA